MEKNEPAAWVPPSFFDEGVVAATACRKPPSETAVALRGAYVPLYAAAPGIDLAPRPMATAPRDGTMLRLLVQFDDHATEDTEGPAWTIGACNDDNVHQDERAGWQFAGWCWDHDHFTEGKGTPVGWLPLIDASPKGGSDAPKYTTGHCENHKKPGGCPLHNLQCGYPQCDRKQATSAEVGVNRG